MQSQMSAQLLTRFLFDPISTDDIFVAKWWFKTLTQVDTNDYEILHTIIDHINEDENNEFPSLSILQEELCSVSCVCEVQYDEENIIDMKKHYMMTEGRIIRNCLEEEIIIEFYTINKKYPTRDEIKEYYQNSVEFERDPVEYFNSDKVDRPSTILSDDIIKEPTEPINENCSICYEQINQSKYYELPCKHMFHINKEDCLGEACIVEWFEKNNFCPNCKTTYDKLSK